MENIQLKKVVRENILDWNVGILVFLKPYLKLRSGILAILGIIVGRIYRDIQSEVTLKISCVSSFCWQTFDPCCFAQIHKKVIELSVIKFARNMALANRTDTFPETIMRRLIHLFKNLGAACLHGNM